MKWYIKVIKQYADFQGRARRKEYWMFALFNFIFTLAAIALDNLFGLTFKLPDIYYGPIYLIYCIAMIIPGLAVSVRRLHDIGKSGWMYLIILIPLIGPIWLLLLFATDGNHGTNEYGQDPKEETVPAE